jgi:serine carboxypeptidase-like clade I
MLAIAVVVVGVVVAQSPVIAWHNAPNRAHTDASTGSATYEEDRIVDLPEYGPPPTAQYSGYLNATDGCNDIESPDQYSCMIHYWLCTASSSVTKNVPAAKAPIVVWFNGGPGASSLVGLFQENGPLLLNERGAYVINPYSWVDVAHLLVLESPVGVGFSYCRSNDDSSIGGCPLSDTRTATTSRAALISFLTKFPHLAQNDLYLMGESYAGVYLPTLAYEIMQFNQQRSSDSAPPIINMQGLLVGDPCTDTASQQESMNPLWYGYQYGLADEAVYRTLTSAECATSHGQPLISILPFAQYHSKDPFYTSMYPESMPFDLSVPDCQLAYRKFLFSSSRGIDGKWPLRYIDRFSLHAPVIDALDEALEQYMNRPDVQAALHIDTGPRSHVNAYRWAIHANASDFSYTKEYSACNHHTTTNNSMIDFYRTIVPQLRVTWILNGDTDPAVSFEGTQTAIGHIGFAELNGGGYRPWFYNHTGVTVDFLKGKPTLFGPDMTLQGTGVQFGGEVVNYEHNLAFLTVHGSGHMIPQFRPKASLHILSSFLSPDPIMSPLLPTNETLSSMSSSEFFHAMDKWTKLAKSTPYVV